MGRYRGPGLNITKQAPFFNHFDTHTLRVFSLHCPSPSLFDHILLSIFLSYWLIYQER